MEEPSSGRGGDQVGAGQMPGLPHWDPHSLRWISTRTSSSAPFTHRISLPLPFRGHCLPLQARPLASAFPGLSSQGCPGLGAPEKPLRSPAQVEGSQAFLPQPEKGLERPSSTRLEARFPSHDSRAMTRSLSHVITDGTVT